MTTVISVPPSLDDHSFEQVFEEIKRRTSKVRVFPNEAALLRLVTAILVEIDEDWATTDRVYINMLDQND